jgi:hypothetical protein
MRIARMATTGFTESPVEPRSGIAGSRLTL